jgi:hypothetical protein
VLAFLDGVLTRRNFARILSFCTVCPALGKPEKPTANQPAASAYPPYDSFDPREWAKAFEAYLKLNPGIAADPEVMRGWFALALNCGFARCADQLPKLK